MKKLLVLCGLCAINTGIYGAAFPKQPDRPELQEPTSSVGVPVQTQEQQPIPFRQAKSAQLAAIDAKIALYPADKEIVKQMTQYANNPEELKRAEDLTVAFAKINKFYGGNPEFKHQFMQITDPAEYAKLSQSLRSMDATVKAAHYRNYLTMQLWNMPATDLQQLLLKLSEIDQTIDRVYRQ